uniref:Zinc knuckle CX2CX4HX4C domain-containing protein n=1 Tax=Cannabis sativa TaxID=3483 RepID=A0A803NJS2_CANSA
MSKQGANITLEDEKEYVLAFSETIQPTPTIDDRWCLVGRFLAQRSIDFDTMQHLMASLWQPGRRMFVKELDDNRTSWELWRIYLQVRVTLDVNKPLKRRRRVKKDATEEFCCNFKYEHVSLFCFICGILGHSEGYCPSLFTTPLEKIVKPYGSFMRAQPHRRNHKIRAKWLGSYSEFIDAGEELLLPEVEDDLTTNTAGITSAMEKIRGVNVGAMDFGEINVRVDPTLSANKSHNPGDSHTLTHKDFNKSTSQSPLPAVTSNMLVVIDNKRQMTQLGLSYGPVSMEEEMNVGLFMVDVQGHSGGLALLWRFDDEANLLGFSNSHIDLKITVSGTPSWQLTEMYGEPNRHLRRKTWDLLHDLSSESSLP